jgi:hypothetical protein
MHKRGVATVNALGRGDNGDMYPLRHSREVNHTGHGTYGWTQHVVQMHVCQLVDWHLCGRVGLEHERAPHAARTHAHARSTDAHTARTRTQHGRTRTCAPDVRGIMPRRCAMNSSCSTVVLTSIATQSIASVGTCAVGVRSCACMHVSVDASVSGPPWVVWCSCEISTHVPQGTETFAVHKAMQLCDVNTRCL